METLWRKVNVLWRSERTNEYFFLFLNVVIYICFGLLIWLLVHFFALKSVDWAICFMGYPGFFIGFVGGILFLWKKI